MSRGRTIFLFESEFGTPKKDAWGLFRGAWGGPGTQGAGPGCTRSCSKRTPFPNRIRGKALDLFTSYLTSGSQFVKLPNGVKSSLTEVDFGVPQGSILGPILFLLFINDLPNASNFYFKLFADDNFLCSQNCDFTLLQNEVNFELEKVFVWLASNKLTLNIKKC